MQNTPQRDTPPELALRRELHRLGYRFRVDARLQGVTRSRPDIAFPTEKVAVYVDGCFWHSCPDHGTLPEKNKDWWRSKLTANLERDHRHTEELESAGWVVVRTWEHDPPLESAPVVAATVDSRRTTTRA